MLKTASDGKTPLRIAVARDCRVSGPRIIADLVGGLKKTGAHVIDVGMGPTPLLYFAVNHLNADGGVMVTGSHNPGDENGFKIMRGKASFFGEDIQALKRRIEARDFPPETAGTTETQSLDDAYVAALTGKIRIKDPTMKVVVDAGNGAAGPLALRAFRALGLDPTALYCDMDGTFPNHHPDPTVPKNLAVLMSSR